MPQDAPTTLYSPTGDKYSTSNRVEIKRLLAYGYSEKKPTPKQVEAQVSKPA